MKFHVSIFGTPNQVKQYRIDLEDTNVGVDFVIGQSLKFWHDLRQASTSSSKILIHGENGIRSASINPDLFFNPNNAITFIKGLIDLATYHINEVVVARLIPYLLMTYEIKAGYRTMPASMHPVPYDFSVYYMAPFAYNTGCFFKHDFENLVASHLSSMDIGKSSRVMCSFGEFIQNIATDIKSGLGATHTQYFPVPAITDNFLRAVLKEAGVEVNRVHLKELNAYASLLAIVYALQIIDYGLKMSQIDQDDFWTALDGFAHMEDAEKRNVIDGTFDNVMIALWPYFKKRRGDIPTNA